MKIKSEESSASFQLASKGLASWKLAPPWKLPSKEPASRRPGLHSSLFTLNSSFSSAAFSLIELLIVMAIIAIMASLLLPALGDSARRSRFNKAISAVAGEMEIAQQAAVAGGTYAWVGFTTNYPPLMVSGRSIGGEAPGTNAVTINLTAATNATQLGRVQTLESALLRPTIINVSTYTTNRPLPAGYASAISPTTNTATLKLSATPPSSSLTTFDWVVEFNPMGEATVRRGGAVPVSAVMVNLVPSPDGTVVETNRAGLVWINGLTGGVEIYQP